VGNKVVLESKPASLILKYLLEDHMREELFANREFEHSLGTLPPAGYPLDLLRVATAASPPMVDRSAFRPILAV
jgi:hypothetical protein